MRKLLLWALLLSGSALLYGGYYMFTKRMTGPRWDRLTPATKQKTLDLLSEAEKAGLPVMFWSGWRDVDGQLKNMSEGTSWVSHPLNSIHPWGEAVDIVFVDFLGMPAWPDPKIPQNLAAWQKLGEIGERIGFDWGGRWRNFDGAHMQRKGVRARDLRAAYADNPLAYLRDQGVMV